MTERPTKFNATLPGIVDEIIQATPGAPETAQIGVQDADDLHRTISIENTLATTNGDKVGLKKGSPVSVTFKG